MNWLTFANRINQIIIGLATILLAVGYDYDARVRSLKAIHVLIIVGVAILPTFLALLYTNPFLGPNSPNYLIELGCSTLRPVYNSNSFLVLVLYSQALGIAFIAIYHQAVHFNILTFLVGYIVWIVFYDLVLTSLFIYSKCHRNLEYSKL